MENQVTVPPKPRKPDKSECCGQGCQFCIFDVYEEELLIWEKKCRELDDRILKQEPAMSPDMYVECTVESVEQLCNSVFLFHFKLPKNMHISFSAGQHAIALGETSDETIFKSYTLISNPGIRAEFSVLIKLYENGKMSSIIREKWKPGYTVPWRGPMGKCDYLPNSVSNVLFIAAGTGITPMFQLVKLIIDNPEDYTKVTLLYGCRTYSEILLRSQLHQLQDYWNFTVHYFLSNDVEENVKALQKHNEDIHYHKINEDVLDKMVNKMKKGTVRVYLCGPKAFERQVTDYLRKFGIEKSSVVTFG